MPFTIAPCMKTQLQSGNSALITQRGLYHAQDLTIHQSSLTKMVHYSKIEAKSEMVPYLSRKAQTITLQLRAGWRSWEVRAASRALLHHSIRSMIGYLICKTTQFRVHKCVCWNRHLAVKQVISHNALTSSNLRKDTFCSTRKFKRL